MLPIQGCGKHPGGPTCLCPRCWHSPGSAQPRVEAFFTQTPQLDILRDRSGAAGVSGEGASFPSPLTKMSPERV